MFGEGQIMFPAPSVTADLSSRVELRIQARTFGRIRDLRVELVDQGVILHGWAPTYYAKQMAQTGAMDVVADQVVINEIEVG
jgi:hypothetical protein